ncbi:MAG: Rne/Rng family ribonuclease [Polyangiales bacterium]
MAGYQIVINVDIGETRVALIENGIVAELHIERRGEKDVVGDVYLGKVTRVLPGMNAAFVDIGLERAAFLHVDDALSDAEFRSYLPDDDEDEPEEPPPPRATPAPPEARITPEPPSPSEPPPEPVAEPAPDLVEAPPSVAAVEVETVVTTVTETLVVEPTVVEPVVVEPVVIEPATVDLAPVAAEVTEGEVVEFPVEVPPSIEAMTPAGAVVTTASAAVPSTRAERSREHNRDRRGRRDGQGQAQGKEQGREPHNGRDRKPQGKEQHGRKGDGRGDNRNEHRGEHRGDAKGSTKGIREVLREGQEIVVQVSKGPISTKGARVTSHISLPGRYVVYMPTVDHVGVSKRIGNEKERRRLREVIDSMKPDKGGLIVRTLSEGLTKKQLKTDVGYLVHLWADICKRRENAKSPAPLYSELDITLRTVRDVFGPECEKIVVDDKETHGRLVRFVEQFMPDRRDDVELYSAREPIFDAYGIEDEIGRALARKVPLKSGGYLIIDQAEALTAIDVNTGRFVGKKDVEETVTATNIEAVAEIAYQLRLRNLGGLIVIDFIDMDRQQNRERVYNALGEALRNDKAKTTTVRISELGLVEMTRKRTRESLGRTLFEPCFYCDGTGHTSSRLTVAYEILRQIRREKDDLKGYSITVNAHPAVADTLKHEAAAELAEAQRRYARHIVVTGRPEYHIEQFDLVGG